MRVALGADEGGTQKLPENQQTEAIRGYPRPTEAPQRTGPMIRLYPLR